MPTKTQVEKGLNKTRAAKQKDAAAVCAKEFYDQNVHVCDDAFKYYSDVCEERNKYIDKSKKQSKEQVQNGTSGKVFLVLTSTEIEECIFLHSLYDLCGVKIPSYIVPECNAQTYHIITTNSITIVHAHTNGTGDEAMRRSINYASRIFDIQTLSTK